MINEVKKKKKLLVVTSTFPRWKNDTIPHFVFELSKRLTDEFDVYVLAPHYPGAKSFEILDNMKVYRFKYFLTKYQKLAGNTAILPTLQKNKWFYFQVPFFLIGEFLALYRLTKKIKPDIIHAHWIIPQGFVAALNKKITGVRYIVTSWGGDMFVFKKQGFLTNLLKKVYSFILNNSKKSTSVNMVFLDEMKRVANDKDKVVYIPNGIDTELFNPKKKDLLIKEKYKIEDSFLLFVGRLSEKKGVRYLIEAMSEVVKKSPKVKLMIIGKGELESELKDLTKKLKMENSIIFTGAIPNKELPRYYATADIFIAPSITTKDGDREGFPTVFLEAMACGNSIITTRIDGIENIIQDGINGYIVNQKSSKELARELIELIQNRKSIKSGKDTFILIKNNYDWSIIKNRYKEILI
ncbi:glycosyltransferase [Candidatus Pacearchaeota archaeon]|nr:glycosyltransferase [Candidatus Pacearchaeota archaeon]